MNKDTEASARCLLHSSVARQRKNKFVFLTTTTFHLTLYEDCH